MNYKIFINKRPELITTKDLAELKDAAEGLAPLTVKSVLKPTDAGMVEFLARSPEVILKLILLNEILEEQVINLNNMIKLIRDEGGEDVNA